ncbi:vomeronasal type-1 receptor 90-like [Ochotona curzoniae]|uniref:vomeronasal type-1 receptor 90-like n=1 Tax=Ochotona curzoniae TaxID=130825 RepID=UPI001B353328|nr:vomeronasal type-1 receptor 90-like [Ochotona curzoniae]
MNRKNMFCSFVAVKCVIFSEVSIGIPANAFLLLFHLSFLLKHKLKPTDLTIGHLALIHLVTLIIAGLVSMDVFQSQGQSWDGIACKALFYLYQVLRGLSLGNTFLLSVLQAIALSPRSSWMAKFKQTSSHHSLCIFLFAWVFSLSMSVHLLICAVASTNHTSSNVMAVTKSCSLWILSYFPRHLLSILWIFQDVSLTGLMALSSAYMVTLLCRHKRQSRHLHSTRLSPRASPELRATRTILLLMGVFVLLYWLDCIMYSLSTMRWNIDSVHMCVQMLVSTGYASIAPLLLISRERRIIQFLKSMSKTESF